MLAGARAPQELYVSFQSPTAKAWWTPGGCREGARGRAARAQYAVAYESGQ